MIDKYSLPHMGGSTISAKLTAKLIAELSTGIFSKDDKLPSELDLAQQFSVSRSVIRDVLANLEREGFVERGRGIGTLIHRNIVNLKTRLDLKFEYFSQVRGMGMEPACDSIRLDTCKAGKLATRLQIDPEENLIICEKRISASGRPVIFSTDHLPESIFGGINWRMLDWKLPVFDLLEDYCGIAVDTDIANITAVIGPKDVREKLMLADEEALLLIDEIGYYKLSRPILQTYGYYSNFFEFTMLRKKF